MLHDSRKLVTRDQLSEILTKQLQATEDLEDATVCVAYVYAEPDDNGVNWSPDVHVNPGSKGSKEYALPHLRRIVQDARALYLVDA